MQLSGRVQNLQDSITLSLNARAVKLAEEGQKIYNLSAGQLPYKPHLDFVESLKGQLNFLKSFQYSPVAGYPDLKEKFKQDFVTSRGLEHSLLDDHNCVISNGGKHSLFNTMGAIVDPSDEVILLAPYWLSYSSMIEFWNGTPKVVSSSLHTSFASPIEEIEKQITPKTKAIILNSPNNPSGVHYSDQWIEQFTALLEKYPEVYLLSDEIYYELSYFDPKPSYPYQKNPDLLKRTIIFDGISKTLASTGLRIGYALGPKEIMSAASKIQSQTASGANSLVQKALIEFDLDKKGQYLTPIKDHLRNNANILKEFFIQNKLEKAWYQPKSAFYFVFDFSQMPKFDRYQEKYGDKDHAAQICEDILNESGVVIVPTSDFGLPNCARMSLVPEESELKEALARLAEFFL